MPEIRTLDDERLVHPLVIDHICPTCGGPVYKRKYRTRKFCTRDCMNNYQLSQIFQKPIHPEKGIMHA